MDEEQSPLVLKKQLHKHGHYLTVSLSEEDCKKLDLKEGDRVQLEKIIEIPATKLADVEPSDINTYNN